MEKLFVPIKSHFSAEPGQNYKAILFARFPPLSLLP